MAVAFLAMSLASSNAASFSWSSRSDDFMAASRSFKAASMAATFLRNWRSCSMIDQCRQFQRAIGLPRLSAASRLFTRSIRYVRCVYSERAVTVP
jgi:hypothetical protein